MSGAYGYCPRCGGLGISRERRLNGNDRCENGHSYPSVSTDQNPLVSTETKRANSLALAYREQQGENDTLRAANTVLVKERDLYREAWAKAQARIDCGSDAADALREERAAVVAWLRTRERQIENWPPGGMNEISLTYNIIADNIERDEHRSEEEE